MVHGPLYIIDCETAKKAGKEMAEKNESTGRVSVNPQTTVSIALVISMCTGAFWTGSQLTKLTVQTEQVRASLSEMRATQLALGKVSQELTLIARQNQARLQHLERSAK